MSPSYSLVPSSDSEDGEEQAVRCADVECSRDQREIGAQDRAIGLSATAEERLYELFPNTPPTFDVILKWTEYLLRGDDAHIAEDEYALTRILDHFRL